MKTTEPTLVEYARALNLTKREYEGPRVMLLATWRRSFTGQVRRQILGRYAEAKEIRLQPQNIWGNTNLKILQIQFRNKTNTSPTLAVTQVWIMGMDRRYGSHPLKGYGSWVWIIGYGSHVGPGYGSGL